MPFTAYINASDILLVFTAIIRYCLNNVRCENSRTFMSKNGLYEQFTTNYHHYFSTF
jgi:predicted sulfurtransferase